MIQMVKGIDRLCSFVSIYVLVYLVTVNVLQAVIKAITSLADFSIQYEGQTLPNAVSSINSIQG